MEKFKIVRILLIVCPLSFLGGLIDSVAGGGGLITLPGYLLAGLPPHMATATNKCGSTFGTILSASRFLKDGHVQIKSACTAAVCALAGAWLGAQLNLVVPDRVLTFLMLAVVPVLAVFLIRKREFGTEDRSGELPEVRLLFLSGLTGLAAGIYDGFFGPGTGTFLILIFTGLCRFDLLTASGNTKIVNAASNAASLVTYAISGNVLWKVGLPAAVFGIAGNCLGSGLALKNGAKIIRPMFFVVLTLLLLRLFYNLLTEI